MHDYSSFLSVFTLSILSFSLLFFVRSSKSVAFSISILGTKCADFCGTRAAMTYLPSSFTKLNTVHALNTGNISTMMLCLCISSCVLLINERSYLVSIPMIRRSGLGSRTVNSDRVASFIYFADAIFQQRACLGKSTVGPSIAMPLCKVNPCFKIT